MLSAYRTDIDCLRALAVLSVFAFHLEIKRFGGGFVGVDIFFVISGYLISRIIIEEVAEGRFTFAAFYERRVRRILPALYAMIALTAVVAWLVLLPVEFADFLRTVAATVLLSSNVWFWLKTGYFEAAASEKPLLHTWSLSVEEQFYLVFPLVVWLIARYGRDRRPAASVAGQAGLIPGYTPNVLAGVAVATVFFLGLGQWMLMKSPTAAFYLAPARAGEFLIGTLVVMLRAHAPTTRRIQTVMALAGAFLMVFAILRFRTLLPFPGWRAAAPCIGAGLVLHAFGRLPMGGNGWITTRIALFFGRISYSLYLWHWPVILFARYLVAEPEGFSTLDRLGMFALSIGLASLSYRFVEQPMRSRAILSDRTSLFRAAGMASLALCGLAVAGLSGGGIQRALDPVSQKFTRYSADQIALDYSETSCFMLPFKTFAGLQRAGCQTLAPGKKNILLWGDSVAAHYKDALKATLESPAVHMMQTTASSCGPHNPPLSPYTSSNCREMNALVLEAVRKAPPAGVILSAQWRPHLSSPSFEAELTSLLQSLAALGIPTIVIGPPVEFIQELPAFLARKRMLGFGSEDQRNVVKSAFQADAMLRAIVGKTSAHYISVLDAMCPERICEVLADPETPLVWDKFHVTPQGSIRVIEAVKPAIQAGLFGK